MHYGRVAQLGERRPYKANVGSSNLSTPTIIFQADVSSQLVKINLPLAFLFPF